MAKSKSLLKLTPKKKAPVVRRSKLADEKYTGAEPTWEDAASLTEEQIRLRHARAYSFYNYHYTVADLRKDVVEYGQAQLGWGRDEIRAFNECEDGRVGITICSWSRMMLRGAPREDSTFAERKLEELMTHGKARLAEKQDKEQKLSRKPTVQELMAEKFQDIMGEIEGWYDAATLGEEYPSDMVAWMREQNVPQVFVNKIGAYYTPAMQELEEAKGKDADAELKGAYKHVDRARFKRITEFYQALTDALHIYGKVKSAARKARTPRPVSKERMVRRVKYCAEDTAVNVVSIKPTDIIGAAVLWVYNRNTRKLGKYVAAADSKQLSIKGSAIIGFDEKQSTCRTLRKPLEQLKAFQQAGKVQLRTFLESIKATPVQLNGRLNKDTLLLKVQ
jgi:hypothetical protein